MSAEPLYECAKCGPVSRLGVLWIGGAGPAALVHSGDGAVRCGPVRHVTAPIAAPSRDQLHARIADVLRRSGVEDAERLIRAMEQDAAEVAWVMSQADAWSYHLGPDNPDRKRIDRALAGNEIGPPKAVSE